MRSDTVSRKSHYFGVCSDIFMALCRRSLERERGREREALRTLRVPTLCADSSCKSRERE